MDEWKVFAKTGSIYDYLKYRQDVENSVAETEMTFSVERNTMFGKDEPDGRAGESDGNYIVR